MTGKKPDLSKLWVFGSGCYTYNYDHKKLDPRCSKGIFVGCDKNSSGYLVYHPQVIKVMKHRLIKFIKSTGVEQCTQTEIEDIGLYRKAEPENSLDSLQKQEELSPEPEAVVESFQVGQEPQHEPESIEEAKDEPKGYPQRERKAPKYFGVDSSAYVSVDYCYRVCGVPQTYNEAINSTKASGWEQAMKEESKSLKENDTFDLTVLSEGENLVGGKWGFAIKENANGSETLKARYVAKGYSQIHGIDYDETFSPTANIISVRILMQLAAQYNLSVHQMDVKAAFLHAPIEHEIFIEQPEGFQELSENGVKLVYRLKKSLYGLKQSGRNWNKVLDEYLINDGVVRNPVDHCVYRKQTGDDLMVVVVWVDHLLLASNSTNMINQFKENMKCKFRMKDLGKISYFLGTDFK